MLDHLHLGDQIGGLDQRLGRVAAGDDDVDVGRLVVAQERDHFVDRQIVVAEHDVEFVEQHDLVLAGGDDRLGALPGGAGRGEVALAILGLPGEALAHRVDRHEVAEFLQRDALAGLPLALDELDDGDRHAVAEGAEDHAEGGRRLALALAGVDDQQALLDRLGGDDLVARRLLLAHLLGVAGVEFGFGHVLHSAASLRASMSADRRS